MASLTPAPTSMIDRLEKYLLSCLQGENIEKIQICSKKHFIYVGNFQTLFIQNYIASDDASAETLSNVVVQ